MPGGRSRENSASAAEHGGAGKSAGGGHGRSLRSKFFASGIILLLTIVTTLMFFLPFMNYELDNQIQRQDQFNRDNIRLEALTISRLLVFDLSRVRELWEILYEPADQESVNTIIPALRTYLWEKVTFNSIIRDIELLDDSGYVNLRPFGAGPKGEIDDPETNIENHMDITVPAYVESEDAGIVTVFMPLYIEGTRWGVVKISVGIQEIRSQLEMQAREQDRFRWLSGIFFIGTLAFSSLVGVAVLGLLARRITEPLKQLARNAELFAREGDVGRLQKIEAEDDEVGLLAESFTRMAGDISRLLSEKDEAYVQLKASQEQLRQSEKLATLGQLSGGIAHEINNALSPIRLRSEEVLMTISEGGKAEPDDLKVILKGIEQCTAIVQKLRDFASPSLGDRSPVNLNYILQETIALVRRQIEKRGIRIQTNFGELPDISASSGELEQVFMNLLLNAKDAIMASGKSGGEIGLTTSVGEGAVNVEVRDDGAGMDEKTRARVFEPFFTTKPVGEGTGLGMSVSFGIIQSHGAEINVESSPGRGTAVKVRFPLPPTGPVEPGERE
ncbi:MAG TPA: ATP-binding protein [Acidobacteriota bacterium]|nr:ATP-binding protein [Acidobacteriota bacterium]